MILLGLMRNAGYTRSNRNVQIHLLLLPQSGRGCYLIPDNPLIVQGASHAKVAAELRILEASARMSSELHYWLRWLPSLPLPCIWWSLS